MKKHKFQTSTQTTIVGHLDLQEDKLMVFVDGEPHPLNDLLVKNIGKTISLILSEDSDE